VAGNEANFFVRDVTNGSKLPFRIVPGAPTNSIYINANGYIGMGDISPEAQLHVFGHIRTDSLLKVMPQPVLPSSAEEGDICMDGNEHKLKYFDGSVWRTSGVNTDEQNLVSATLTGSMLEIEIENGASVSVDLSPLLADLEASISALDERISALEAITGTPGISEEKVELLQNIPNPSEGVTIIPYFIPVTIRSAKIVIYDAQGAHINDYILAERGNKGEIILNNTKLKSGMYFYTLVVDGRPFDTKSMSIIK
jgi:hypothetical protein